MKKLVLFFIGVALVLSASSVNALQLSVGDWAGFPTLGFHFNDKFTGYLGYSYIGSTKISYGLAKVDMNLAKIMDAQTKGGVYYSMTSPNNGSTLGLTWGASVMVLPNVSVGADIDLVSQSTTAGGTSTTNFLQGAYMVFNLLI